MTIEVGTEAPDFTLRDQDGQERTLSEERGRPVLLAFYGFDWSPAAERHLRAAWERVAPAPPAVDDAAEHDDEDAATERDAHEDDATEPDAREDAATEEGPLEDLAPWEEASGPLVLGVGVDSTWSHRAWREAAELPCDLVSDPALEVARRYGLLHASGLAARPAVVVVDADGIVRHVAEADALRDAPPLDELVAALVEA